MKRFALILTTVAALTIFSSSSADAFDGHGGHHGYAGHGFVGAYGGGYGYGGYGHGNIVRRRVVHRGYAAPIHGGYGYGRSLGHGGGLRISTPHFGFRLGH